METIIGILSHWPNLVLLSILGVIAYGALIKYLKPEITFGPYEARERKRALRNKT
ncbi:MAG: hypothetical protein V3U54_07860 [Thermodesulfobacteriota bacterium]